MNNRSVDVAAIATVVMGRSVSTGHADPRYSDDIDADDLSSSKSWSALANRENPLKWHGVLGLHTLRWHLNQLSSCRWCNKW